MEHRKCKISDGAAYRAICGVFRKRRGGVTVADVVAGTALPLETVRGLVNDAADEYSARISVTESGEILYSFPRGFTSRYRGFKATAKRALGKVGRALKIAGAALFKAWIMIMLIGYFVLFMVIALAALVLSAAASNSSNNSNNRRDNSGGGLFFVSGIFDFIIRIWFYSELTKSFDRHYGSYGRTAPRPKGRPLYKAIFSFVFGDGDPNAGMETRERQAVIAYIQANKGIISLPEFMILTGTTGSEADSLVSAYCSEYGGMPEATEDGTVVYRFDALLLRADRADRSSGGFSVPLKMTEKFSQNKTKMNVWFCLINSVNLIFGSYFFVNVMNSGHILTPRDFNAASFLYARTYVMMNNFIANPLPVISIGLGIVPFVFSLFFWLIPLARYALLKKNNEKIKLENLRKNAFMFIWDKPGAVNLSDINPAQKECRPKNMDRARERVIKDMGQYSIPDVSVNESGEAVYSFNELKREKDALFKYRSGINPGDSELGKVIFKA
ncbi:MAG: hypothetical protein LBF83_11030 [Spirochaetaceae bacterium]|jgi:hypothetical protein|nr:hypothetical protein [Spirochaetaceae bacterium]